MQATENLKEEHKAIKVMLQILDKVCQKLEAGEKVNPDHLAQTVDFIKVFADKCHHGKEEDALFPALVAVGIPKERGPVGVMLIEHNKGRDYVKGMSEAVAEYSKGNRQASAKFVENAKNYIALLSQHIDKEETVLFPMGNARLSKETQAKLSEEFERIENERIGPGKHEELHILLHRLNEIYG